ncbi:MAG: hypothetical protein O3B41_10305 [Bacteroidetes bacterium]|nr:hypothetical protein [Bacteroidota bacterium]
MRHTTLLLVFVITTQVSWGQSSTWDAADLSARGTVRFTELLQTLEPLRFWTTDRYTTRIVGSGMGGSHSQGPQVLVDGLLFSPRFMDRTELELIPISPADIAGLSYRPGNTMLSDGRLSDGVIELKTNKPLGLSFRGLVGLTNETGDPGPVKYTNPLAKNVDRSGPTAAVRASWGSRFWYVQMGLDTDAFHMTDDRIEGRVWRIYAGNQKPVVSHITQSVRISHSSPSTSLELWAGQTTKNNFLFDEIAGFEWPVEEARKWSKGRFEQALSTHWRLGLSGGYETWKSSNFSAQIKLPSPLSITDASAELNLTHSTPTFSAFWAVGGRQSRARQAGNRSLRSLEVIHGRTGFGWGLASNTQLPVNGGLSIPAYELTNWKAVSYTASLELQHKKPNQGWLKAGLTIRSDIAEDVWTTLDLVEAGIHLNDWALNVVAPVFDSRAESIEAFLYNSSRIRENLLFWTEFRARRMSGLILPERNFVQSGSDLAFTSATNFRSGRAGLVMSPGFGLSLRTEKSRTEISYQFIRLVANGDVLFWKSFSGLSPHHVKGTFTISPNPRFHLFTSISVNNSALWPEYPSFNRNRIAGFVQLDGSASKDFWNDRLRVSLSIINMLNRSIVRHPVSVDEQMAVRLGVLVQFSDHTKSSP